MNQAETTTPSGTSQKWLVIRPPRRWQPLDLAELWDYRDLIFFLTWRDIKIRYKQTLLGISWAILQPFSQMVVFTIFFGQLAGLDSEGVPYAVFNYAALLPWTYFASSLTQSSNSVVTSAKLIQKVYFPRLIIPLTGVLGGLPDFFLSFIVMLGLLLFYGMMPNPLLLLLLIPFSLLAVITALGVGLWLSALNAMYRDVRYVIPFLVQLWMFITPVVYSTNLIENPIARTLYGFNPMVSVVNGFRWVLLGQPFVFEPMQIVSILMALALLTSGLFFYRRMEKTIADVV